MTTAPTRRPLTAGNSYRADGVTPRPLVILDHWRQQDCRAHLNRVLDARRFLCTGEGASVDHARQAQGARECGA